jgi:hypothetical protein
MKIIRLGMTEAGLVFLTYLSGSGLINDPILKKNISDSIISLVNWLYTTSGYYDKEVKANYFNFDITSLNKNFFNFIKDLRLTLENCDRTYMLFHKGFITSLFEKYGKEFIEKFNIKNLIISNHIKFEDRMQEIFNHIKDKKVLVISSFDGLIKKQYENGNVYKIYDKFPKIKSLDTLKFPYCFLNNGPDKNYFETLDKIYEEIKKKDFDVVLLGCGAYGHMLTHKIHAELNKEAIYVGGYIQTLFGIKNTRNDEHKDLITNKYWITQIPNNYKPSNYKLIENGCYW